MALEQQRAEGERLAGRPVDALAGLDRLAAVVEEALDGAVDVEALAATAVIFSPISFSVSIATPVSPRRGSSSSRAALMPAQRPSSQSALLGL